MAEEIKEGSYVRLKKSDRKGIVTAIVDYGTHVCYFVNIGEPIKFPARREWLELIENPE